MSDSIITMKEKMEWLKTFINHVDSASKRTAELLFSATNIPRKTSWQDLYILQIIEITDKQRIFYDELANLNSITIVKDVDDCIDVLNSKITELEAEKEDIYKSTKEYYEKLELKKKKLIASLTNKKIDPWICVAELKNTLRDYIEERDKSLDEIKIKTYEADKIVAKCMEKYRNIIRNLFKIQSNHFLRLSELFENEDIENKLNSLDEEVYYDAVEESKDGENRNTNLRSGFDTEYKTIINEIKEKDTWMDPEGLLEQEMVVKHGIYKYKKSTRNEWRICFIVFTSNMFLHGFDLDSILQRSKNINVKYSHIIQKINSIILKKLSFFFENRKCETLNLNEEIDFIGLTEAIREDETYIHSPTSTFSFNIKEKIIRLDKERYEIIISAKNANSFTSLFVSNVIKIKPYVLKDMYELFFAFSKKNPVAPNKEIIADDDIQVADVTVDEPIKEDNPVQWASLEDNNPWDDI